MSQQQEVNELIVGLAFIEMHSRDERARRVARETLDELKSRGLCDLRGHAREAVRTESLKHARSL